MKNIKEKNEEKNMEIIKENNNAEENKNLNEKDKSYPNIPHLYVNNNKNQKEGILKKRSNKQSIKGINKPIKFGNKLPYLKMALSKTNNLKINNLFQLEPFFSDFNNNMEKKGKEILRGIASDYKDEYYETNKILFRYGDEADRFFIINNGTVSLYFPFTEVLSMNIDEYYIYILRLRRYNEIEMLNNVLLLNEGKFMREFNEGFEIDKYIFKLYITYIKLLFDPTFLYQHEDSKKRKIKKIANIPKFNSPLNINKKLEKNFSIDKLLSKRKSIYYSFYLRRSFSSFGEEEEIDINIFDTFNDRAIKEMLLRIGNELIDTMKWVMPDKMYVILEEKNEDTDEITKKIVSIPKILFIKYKGLNANVIDRKEYIQRILPVKRPNNKLISKNLIIMKYLYIDTLQRGQCFGDFNPDSLSLFSHLYLNIAKKSSINLNLHKFHYFRNMTAISTASHSEINININKKKIHLFSFNRKIFQNYFSKYIEKRTYDKKRFLLNNPIFQNTYNINMVKTYSACFKERKIKEREYIISERDKLRESNIYISFIAKGEFQANCTKSISEIDEIIKQLGYEENIKETYSEEVKDIINTPFYNELIKRPLNLKLNYFSVNDIVGLTDNLTGNKYFNNIQCTSDSSKVYSVDVRIIKLFADSDPVINDNKNVIIFKRYQMLSDILLKQRKIFFKSFINLDKNNNENNINDIENNLINNINNNNYNNSSKIHIIKSKDNINIQKYKTLPKIKTILSSFNDPFSKLKQKNMKSPQNIDIERENKCSNNNSKNLGDLDLLLINSTGRFSLNNLRNEKSLEIRKKFKKRPINANYNSNDKKLIPRNISIRKKNKRNLFFCDFQQSNSLYNTINKVIPLSKDKENKKYDTKYDLVISYDNPLLKKSVSTSEINPLFYDDFNRSYNTSQYFNMNYEENNNKEKSIDKKDNLEYSLIFKSDVKLIKKPNKFIKNDVLTQRLRKLYKGNYEKILYMPNKKSKFI